MCIFSADPNVRVACLTCFGAVVSIQPSLMEICHIIQPSIPPLLPTRPTSANDLDLSNMTLAAESTVSNTEDLQHLGCNGSAPVSPGTTTPVFSEQSLQAHARETSWLIKLCMKNIHPHADIHSNSDEPHYEPLPVRLESLQVLANLVKSYFPIVR